MTREQLEAIKKEDEVVCDFTYNEISKDENGYPVFKIEYTNPPSNFKKVSIDPTSNLAILKDLDYVPPAS